MRFQSTLPREELSSGIIMSGILKGFNPRSRVRERLAGARVIASRDIWFQSTLPREGATFSLLANRMNVVLEQVSIHAPA